MSLVDYQVEDGIARIRLLEGDRGNPLRQATVDELTEAVRRARADDAHIVVLSGSGSAFSFGGDIAEFAEGGERTEYLVDDLAESLHRVVADLQQMDALVVSAVHGVAAGAGLSLAVAADLVLAAESARFTLAYTKIGFSPDGGSTLLAASLGLHAALRLALLNPVLSAEEARASGLVAEVYPDEAFESKVDQLLTTLRTGSRSAQVAAKRLIREVATPSAVEARRRETLAIRQLAAGPDGRAGVAAFMIKDSPVFPSGAAGRRS